MHMRSWKLLFIAALTSTAFITLPIIRAAPKSTTISPDQRVGWVGPSTVYTFPYHFRAGWEPVGNRTRSLFICEGLYRKAWHIGKTARDFSGCNIGWGGREITVKQFYGLKVGKKARLGWVADSNGRYPKHAVSGRNINEDQKVCRALYRGGIHPGKLFPRSRACHIGYGGHEIKISRYEVLVVIR